MITEINLNVPKTTGVTAPTTADFVKLNVSATRKYLEIINTSSTEIDFAIGNTAPANDDYITIGANGHWSVGHSEFFSSVSSINLWLKAGSATNVVIVS